MNIFDLANDYPNITFVLSNDIRMSENFMNRHNISDYVRERIVYIGKNSSKNISSLSIETLTSTDRGVAFLITTEDKVIYHAGDLNWWSWNGETDAEYKDMKNRFTNEINKLYQKNIDVAFVPLDPRQEDRFYLGFDYFMKTTQTKVAFPMHCWEDYTVINKLKNMDIAKDYVNQVMDITNEGQTFTI